jgi:hypothetical protein
LNRFGLFTYGRLESQGTHVSSSLGPSSGKEAWQPETPTCGKLFRLGALGQWQTKRPHWILLFTFCQPPSREKVESLGSTTVWLVKPTVI